MAFNVAIAAVLLVPIWWQYAVVSGGLFPARLSGDSGICRCRVSWCRRFLTPISAAFLHGGIAHVVLNMLMLLLIGKMVERVLGGGLYLLLYLVGAYGGGGLAECGGGA